MTPMAKSGPLSREPVRPSLQVELGDARPDFPSPVASFPAFPDFQCGLIISTVERALQTCCRRPPGCSRNGPVAERRTKEHPAGGDLRDLPARRLTGRCPITIAHPVGLAVEVADRPRLLLQPPPTTSSYVFLSCCILNADELLGSLSSTLLHRLGRLLRSQQDMMATPPRLTMDHDPVARRSSRTSSQPKSLTIPSSTQPWAPATQS